jgi:hypothetical protein
VELAARLAKHTKKILTECMTAAEMRSVSHHRGRIRQLEGDMRAVNQVLEALDRRFPDPAVRRRAKRSRLPIGRRISLIRPWRIAPRTMARSHESAGH